MTIDEEEELRLHRKEMKRKHRMNMKEHAAFMVIFRNSPKVDRSHNYYNSNGDRIDPFSCVISLC